MSRIDESGYDVVVVGSGAAGSVIAAVNAEAGKRVLILEAGPSRELNELFSSQIWARRLKWSGAPVIDEGNLPVGHNFNAGWGTGGAALHHYAVWPRLHEADFSVKTDHGIGLDWPIQYRDLRSYYDKIQEDVIVSGDSVQEVWRPSGDPYPNPALPIFPQAQIIQKGFRAKGMLTAPTPLAIKSVSSHGRAGCLYDGWCDAGCPIGALANPLVTYLSRALHAGAEIRNRATVARVLHDSGGHRATHVEYFDENGSPGVVYGKQFVVAAFTVQTSRILLCSASERYPGGLGNQSDMVGRYLMTHPSVSIYGLFGEDTYPAMGVTGGHLISQDRYEDKRPNQSQYGSYQWLIGQAVKPNDLLGIANSRPDIYGKALEPFMHKAAKHFANMTCVGEDIANPENRVRLSHRKDNYNLPLAHCVHNIGSTTKSMLSQAQAEGLEIFRLAGATETWTGRPFGMHIMGGTVMGTDESNSVTDSYGRLHNIDNLFIAGPSLFPGSGAVNPTFTIHALALRTAEHMLVTG